MVGGIVTLAGCTSAPSTTTAQPAAAPGAVQSLRKPSTSLLHATFADHAVLQRDRQIPVWGDTVPGAEVEVTLAGLKAHAVADASGHWRVVLAALPAGGPYVLSARSSEGSTQTATDVLIGDAYLCSGQSNIEWPVYLAMHGEADVAASNNPMLHLFTVQRAANATAQQYFGTEATWTTAAPSSVRGFSAVCYFFGRELQKKTGVPIGLIYAGWGASTIEAWMSNTALRAQPQYESQLNILSAYVADPAEAKEAWRRVVDAWWRQHDEASSASPPWHDQAYDDSTWPQTIPTGSWKEWGVPALKDYNGTLWLRTTVSLTAAEATGAATLVLGSIDQADTTWVNGVGVGENEGWNTKREYQVPAGTLHAGANTIAVGILGGDGMWGPTEQRSLTFADGTSVKLDSPWRYRKSTPIERTGAIPHTPWLNEIGLTMLYNGMIAPLGPTPLRGVVWYQGESNTSSPRSYGALLKGLIDDWRRQFGSETQFLIVQLPGYGAAGTAPQDSAWAQLREQQRLVAETVPSTGLAVTIDLGDRFNLHPVVKQEVGRRLALLAEEMIRGTATTSLGPAPVSAVRTGKAVVVKFKNTARGLMTYGAARPIGFELCDGARRCRYADASVESDRVEIVLVNSKDAEFLRFCWADSPVCNLYNSEGLPAVPFEMPITRMVRGHKQ